MLTGTINPGSLSIVREIKYDETPDDNIDTAVFQGTFAEYEIEGSVDLNGDGDFNDAGEFTGAVDVNGDGFISVRDRDTGAIGAVVDGVQLGSRGALTDDTDLLKNIEQLQFADRTVSIGGDNNLATGTVTINDDTPFNGLVTPHVGQVLTATLSDFADADGIPLDANGMPVGLTFEWQTTEIGSNAGWATIQTSETYTVRSVDPGHACARLRCSRTTTASPSGSPRPRPTTRQRPTPWPRIRANGTIVGLTIPFSIDYDAQPINGQPPADVDLTTLHHEIDPANSAGGRFTVIPNGVDFNGFPRYSLVVDQGGPVMLNYEAPVHTPANQSHQFPDNQYQVVINTYDAPGGTLVAVRQFSVNISDVTGEPINLAPAVDLNADATIRTTTEANVADNFNTGVAQQQQRQLPTGRRTGQKPVIPPPETSQPAAQIQLDNIGTNELRLLDNGNGAAIQRSVDLTGLSGATLQFGYDESSFDGGETVVAQFSFNGGTTWHNLLTMNSNTNGGGTYTQDLAALLGPGESFGPNGIIRVHGQHQQRRQWLRRHRQPERRHNNHQLGRSFPAPPEPTTPPTTPKTVLRWRLRSTRRWSMTTVQP